jgi:hypothetical protein
MRDYRQQAGKSIGREPVLAVEGVIESKPASGFDLTGLEADYTGRYFLMTGYDGVLFTMPIFEHEQHLRISASSGPVVLANGSSISPTAPPDAVKPEQPDLQKLLSIEQHLDLPPLDS